ncbi:hypothetical protein XENTR_v10017611 [Xenopus tropicalis]|nr:hypothetical protein XENTR_v10017611 [Xenopus tropicalis]
MPSYTQPVLGQLLGTPEITNSTKSSKHFYAKQLYWALLTPGPLNSHLLSAYEQCRFQAESEHPPPELVRAQIPHHVWRHFLLLSCSMISVEPPFRPNPMQDVPLCLIS